MLNCLLDVLTVEYMSVFATWLLYYGNNSIKNNYCKGIQGEGSHFGI